MSLKPNELTPFTFKDGGYQVQIRKVSPLLVMEVQRGFPPPEPPMQEVDYGDGKKKLEPNAAHPSHLKAMKAYDTELELRVRRAMIQFGVVYTLTDDDKQRLKEIRDYWAENKMGELEKNDLVAFISYVAIGSPDDMNELIETIMRRSQPTEMAVKQAAELFPDTIQGTPAQ